MLFDYNAVIQNFVVMQSLAQTQGSAPQQVLGSMRKEHQVGAPWLMLCKKFTCLSQAGYQACKHKYSKPTTIV